MNGEACNTWCWTLFDATEWDEQMKLIKAHKSVIRLTHSLSLTRLSQVFFAKGNERAQCNLRTKFAVVVAEENLQQLISTEI